MGWPGRRWAATMVLVVSMGTTACQAGGSPVPGSVTSVAGPSPTSTATTAPPSPAASATPPTTPTTDDGTADAVAPLGLRTVATESTLFNTQRTFRLELHNEGDRTVTVEGLQLVSPLFEQVAETRRSFPVAPDDTVLVPLAFGPSRCGDDPAASPAPGRLVVSVNGRPLDLELEDRPVGLLAARRDRECAVTTVQDAVDIGFGPRWERLGPRRAAGEVVVTAGQEVSAVVDDLRGNIVLGIAATATATTGEATADAGEPDAATASPATADPADLTLATLEPGATEARIPVTVSADRCDVHALIESKTTFVFTVVVTVDDAAPVTVPFEPADGARDVVEQLLEACLE